MKLILTEKADVIVEKGRAVQQHYREILTDQISNSDMEVFQRCLDTVRQNIEEAKENSGKVKSIDRGDKKK